jgi:hypothetical protein
MHVHGSPLLAGPAITQQLTRRFRALQWQSASSAPGGFHRSSDRSGFPLSPVTRSEVAPFQVRAEVRTPLAEAVEENSDLAEGLWDCGEVAAHNPQTGPRQEVAVRSRKAAVRNREVVACSPKAAARPPLASTCGHVDQDSSRADMRAAQPLQEALQVHLEHNSHKVHGESRRRSLQPPESHQIWQIPVRPIQPGQRA